MGLYSIAKNALPQSMDINQIIQAFQGLIDLGVISQYQPLSAPSSAPSTSASTTTGNPSGTYGYVFTDVTGVQDSSGQLHVSGETLPSPVSSSVTVSSKEVDVSGITVGTTGVIARNVYRNKSAGSATTGPFYLVTQISNNTQTTLTDNVADASLGVLAPTSNTTGTVFNATSFGGLPSTDYLRTDSGAPNPQTVAKLVNFTGGVQSNGQTLQPISDASGVWTPASGSLNVAVGTVINVAAVPNSAKSFYVCGYGYYNLVMWGSTTPNGTGFTGTNLFNSGSVSSNQSNGLSSTTMVYTSGTSGQTIGDGSYKAYVYFQINAGYLQFVVTGGVGTMSGAASTIYWGVS